MTYLQPALARGLNGWNAPQCATAVAARRVESRREAASVLDLTDAVRIDPATGRVSVWC